LELKILNYKRVEYLEALEIQRALQERRILGKIPDTLLVLEHDAVLTMGKRAQLSNILASKQELLDKGIATVDVERGGDVTYHGPGQLVVYPILDLTDHKKDIRDYVSKLQDVIINVLHRQFKIDATKKTGIHTGVWLGDKKIAAIGISVSKWVTMHGFALNVNTDLSHFDWIVPCGLAGFGVTSIAELTGAKVDFAQVSNHITEEFIRVFGYKEVFVEQA